MRTITENLLSRLAAQATEAEVQGLVKVAEHLTNQLEKNPVRDNDVFYSYANNEFKKDIEVSLWDAIVRIADFHNTTFDATEMQGVVEKVAEDLVSEVRVKLGVVHGIGSHEPTVCGEVKQHTSIEVDE